MHDKVINIGNAHKMQYVMMLSKGTYAGYKHEHKLPKLSKPQKQVSAYFFSGREVN